MMTTIVPPGPVRFAPRNSDFLNVSLKVPSDQVGSLSVWIGLESPRTVGNDDCEVIVHAILVCLEIVSDVF